MVAKQSQADHIGEPLSSGSFADLHVHTKYSDRPSEWLLRRIGSPESFTQPIEVYERAMARGMNFVTVSDHNRIDGALAIAHLPNTFISCEVTTYFPEDGAKIHCLVTGITEAQFSRIEELRENIYDFRAYLLEQDIVYSVAHPFFRVNERLTPDHVEKLLVLFNRFEGINGTRDPRASELVRAVFGQISPELIEKMADRHGLEPIGKTPWIKCFTGGSDDHGGVYIASAYTRTPRAKSVDEYLDFLRRGLHEPGGNSGSSVMLAHSFYHIAYSYYRSRFAPRSGKPNLMGELFRRLLERPDERPLTLVQRTRKWVQRLAMAPQRRKFSDVERMLVDEFGKLLSTVEHAGPGQSEGRQLTDQKTFEIACKISHQLAYSFFQKFVDHASEGRLIESLQMLASLGPVAMAISPYLAAMATQHKDEAFLQQVAERFEAGAPLRLRSERKAWITDTFDDVNGVTRTIRTMAAAAQRAGLGDKLTVISSVPGQPRADFDLKNFPPVGQFALPEYSHQQLSVPPFLEVIEYIEKQRFSQLVISTPGPMGLAALAAGRLLGVKTAGIYHTDFPMYVRRLTQDAGLEQLTWRYMCWFYGQMDQIFVPSEYYRRQLLDGGFEPEKIRLVGHGVDSVVFSPEHRVEDFWRRYGLDEGFTFLYVGRISEEKNIEQLLSDFGILRRQYPSAQLVVVGDGPLLPALRKRHASPGVVFTGALHGLDLTLAYASSDVFVFPSKTDTFGNVVLEASASGLPCIVTNRGGPQEIVVHMRSGMVVDPDRPCAFAGAMQRLITDQMLTETMSLGARRRALEFGWDGVFAEFWESLNSEPVRPAAQRAQGEAEVRHLVLDVN